MKFARHTRFIFIGHGNKMEIKRAADALNVRIHTGRRGPFKASAALFML